jgi:hypothetical protein
MSEIPGGGREALSEKSGRAYFFLLVDRVFMNEL